MRGLITLPLEDTVDVHTAARMARVSESTIRRWCSEGRVAACKPVGRWHLYRFGLWTMLEAAKPGAAPPRPRQLAFSFPEDRNAQNA